MNRIKYKASDEFPSQTDSLYLAVLYIRCNGTLTVLNHNKFCTQIEHINYETH